MRKRQQASGASASEEYIVTMLAELVRMAAKAGDGEMRMILEKAYEQLTARADRRAKVLH